MKNSADIIRITFLDAPVPVDVFILDSERMQEKWGVAAAVARKGMQLT